MRRRYVLRLHRVLSLSRQLPPAVGVRRGRRPGVQDTRRRAAIETKGGRHRRRRERRVRRRVPASRRFIFRRRRPGVLLPQRRQRRGALQMGRTGQRGVAARVLQARVHQRAEAAHTGGGSAAGTRVAAARDGRREAMGAALTALKTSTHSLASSLIFTGRSRYIVSLCLHGERGGERSEKQRKRRKLRGSRLGLASIRRVARRGSTRGRRRLVPLVHVHLDLLPGGAVGALAADVVRDAHVVQVEDVPSRSLCLRPHPRPREAVLEGVLIRHLHHVVRARVLELDLIALLQVKRRALQVEAVVPRQFLHVSALAHLRGGHRVAEVRERVAPGGGRAHLFQVVQHLPRQRGLARLHVQLTEVAVGGDVVDVYLQRPLVIELGEFHIRVRQLPVGEAQQVADVRHGRGTERGGPSFVVAQRDVVKCGPGARVVLGGHRRRGLRVRLWRRAGNLGGQRRRRRAGV